MNAYGWLWETTWQASLLVVLVLAVQKVFRRWLTAEWRDALWWLVVIRLCLPVLPESSFSIFNALRASHKADVTRSIAVVSQRQVTANVSEGTVKVQPNQVKPMPIAAAPSSVDEGFDWWGLMQLVWLVGAVAMLGRTLLVYLCLRRRIAGLPEVTSGRLVMLLDSARRAMKIRHSVRLHESAAGFGPALVGLWRPRLVIPTGLAEELSDEELRYVFLHECGHLRRFDLGINWLLTLLQAVHWFNPVLWLAFRRMRADRELACDEMTLRVSSDSRAYGETIVRLLERAMFGGRPGLVGIVEKKADIRERIRMIAEFHRASRWSIIAVTLMFALGLTMLTDAKPTPAVPKIVLSPVIVSETGTGMRQANLLERVENLVWQSRVRDQWARLHDDRSEEFERQSALWQQALKFHMEQRDRVLRELDEQIASDEDRFRLLERERGLWHRQFIRLCNPDDLTPLRNLALGLRSPATDAELARLAKSLHLNVAAIDRGETLQRVDCSGELKNWSSSVLVFYRNLVGQVQAMTLEARNGRRRVYEAEDTGALTAAAQAWITDQHFPRAESSLAKTVDDDPRRFMAYALRRTILERRMDPHLYQSTTHQD